MTAERTTGEWETPPERPHSPRRRLRIVLVSVAACVALAVSGVLVGFALQHPQKTPAAAGPASKDPSRSGLAPQRLTAAKAGKRHSPAVAPGYSLVARLKASTPGYSRPGGPVKVRVPAKWQTIPSMLAVIGQAPGGWLHVRLAQRPDESTAWIRASDTIVTTTAYRIVVNLHTTHLQLYKLNRLVMDVPVGVGAPATPTPLGHYFVAFLEPSLGPGYGAFIMITSAHSQAISSWDGTGDAIIAIHGPVGADAEIGTTGAHISNGCVRMHDAELLRLETVPPGTPIDIVR